MEDLRQHEDLKRLHALLDQHSVTVVSGGVGLGKSLLLTSLANQCAGRTIQIPYHRTEATNRFSGLDIVLAGLRSLDADRFTLDLGDDGATELTIAEKVLTALRSADIPAGSLLIIPGGDTMDGASQVILGHILRRFSDPRLNIVVSACRITDESPYAGIPRLELRGYPRSELIDLAHRVTAGRIAAESACLAARVASGRPHALRLILDEMPESQKEGRFALLVPVRTGSASVSMAREIIGDLDAEVEQILKMLSLAPLTHFSHLQRQLPELGEHLAELESRGVVERRGSFLVITEELVRAAIHWSMDTTERIALHGRLAETCATMNTPMEQWHRSFTRVDDDTAGALAEYGLSLVERGLVDAGIEFVERAITVSADVSALAGCLTGIAEALFERSDVVFASRYVRFSRESSDPAISVRARTLGIRIGFVQAQTLPTRLINSWTRVELTTAPCEVARLQLVLGQLHCDRGEITDARELWDAAQHLEEHFSSHERVLSAGLRMSIDAARGDDHLVLLAFAALCDLDVDDVSAEYLLIMASALTMTEHYESARAALDLLRDVCGDAATWRTQAMYLQAEIAIRAGQIGHALTLIESFAGRSAVHSEVRQDRLLLLQCWHLLFSGRASDAEVKEAQLVAYATKTRNDAVLADLSALQGSYLLRMALPTEAARHLHRCDEQSAGEVNPNRFRHEPDLIEALIRLGRREHAALLMQRLRHRIDRCSSHWAEGALRRCEALLASGHRSVELFKTALRHSDTHESTFEKALTHTAFANRLAELGSDSRSRDHGLIAASLYHEIGAEAFAVRPVSRPSESYESTPAARPELTGLSDEERMVVEMVRVGMKNREIAGRIFVSLRTVELRLTAVYRKLTVTSRTELIALLAGTPPLAPVSSTRTGSLEVVRS